VGAPRQHPSKSFRNGQWPNRGILSIVGDITTENEEQRKRAVLRALLSALSISWIMESDGNDYYKKELSPIRFRFDFSPAVNLFDNKVILISAAKCKDSKLKNGYVQQNKL
jgi:hypothetical protein